MILTVPRASLIGMASNGRLMDASELGFSTSSDGTGSIFSAFSISEWLAIVAFAGTVAFCALQAVACGVGQGVKVNIL